MDPLSGLFRESLRNDYTAVTGKLTSEIMLKCSKQIIDSYSTVRKRPRGPKVEK